LYVDYSKIPNMVPEVVTLIERFYGKNKDRLYEVKFADQMDKVLRERYLLKDAAGNTIETHTSMLIRVAVAPLLHLCVDRRSSGETYDHQQFLDTIMDMAWEYYDMMASLRFLPNSPTLMNAGTKMGQLSACFVLPVEDSMDGIFGAVHAAAKVHQSGGGTGFDFSNLRPTNSYINSTGGKASGPVSFMKAFNTATGVIAQGGKRRGANMGMLRCLAGDTMVHTLEGRKPIKDLVGTRPYVYAADPVEGRVRIVLADKVFVSDTDREMVRVWIDNDTFIDCTPDHRFMMSDGEYVEAQDLVRGYSLMAFSSSITPSNNEQGGNRYHRMVGLTGFGKQAEHRIVAQDVLGWIVDYDNIVHHIDGDVLNNLPENLEPHDRSSHGKHHHSEVISDHQKRIASERKGRTLEEVYGPEKAAEWKQKMSEAAKVRNHKVVKVEWLDDNAAEVYDISLPEYHNFAANEVFVHNCDHPDVLEFIKAKDMDAEVARKIRDVYPEFEMPFKNFNLSVAITDEFMEALNGEDGDGTYPLRDPQTGKVVDWLVAKDIWQMLCEHAWIGGDPGVVFIDTINDKNPFDIKKHPEHIMRATNPCWTGDTKVWTIYGAKTFSELAEAGDDVPVLTKLTDGTPAFRMMRSPRKTQGNVEVVELVVRAHCSSKRGQTGEVDVLRCTPDHNVILSDGRKVMVKDLQPGDSIASVYRGIANQKGYVALSYGMGNRVMEHHVIAEFKYGRPVDYPNEHAHHIDENKSNNHPDNIEIMSAAEHNSMNKSYEKNPMFGVWDERNPLFGRNVAGKNNPRWKGISDEMLLAMREDGLSGRAIARRVGLDQSTVNARLRKLETQPMLNHTVVEVRPYGTADVYNGTVDETHTYFVMCGDNDAVLSANCGEQPLEAYEACNLGSVNLNKFIRPFGSNYEFDYEEMRKTIHLAIRYLNDVMDSNKFPLTEIAEKVSANRKIGLGVMGLADVIMWLGYGYDDSAGQAVARTIMECFKDYAYEASENLAILHGQTFATFGHLKGIVARRRNATLTTIAPTGTIGMLAGASGGIEPVFALSYVKTVMDGEKFPVVIPYVEHLHAIGKLSDDELEYIKKTGQPSDEILAKCPELATAYTVSPDGHLAMQSIVQEYTDNAVSKTINLPNSATVETIDRIYRDAYKLGCKGVTVYRDGSLHGQVLTSGTEEKSKEAEVEQAVEEIFSATSCDTCPALHGKPTVNSRPESLIGMTPRIETGCGKLYVTLNMNEDGSIVEVFTRLGKGGNCAGASAEVVGRLVSNMLRSGIDVTRVIKQLKNVSCGRQAGFGPNKTLSCYDALGKVLQRYVDGYYDEKAADEVDENLIVNEDTHTVDIIEEPVYVPAQGACPECGGSIMMAEGCMSCHCGWSKCS
jgi:ribonucleotide reductase alpha subunit